MQKEIILLIIKNISKIRLFLDNKGIAQPLSSLFGKY